MFCQTPWSSPRRKIVFSHNEDIDNTSSSTSTTETIPPFQSNTTTNNTNDDSTTMKFSGDAVSAAVTSGRATPFNFRKKKTSLTLSLPLEESITSSGGSSSNSISSSSPPVAAAGSDAVVAGASAGLDDESTTKPVFVISTAGVNPPSPSKLNTVSTVTPRYTNVLIKKTDGTPETIRTSSSTTTTSSSTTSAASRWTPMFNFAGYINNSNNTNSDDNASPATSSPFSFSFSSAAKTTMKNGIAATPADGYDDDDEGADYMASATAGAGRTPYIFAKTKTATRTSTTTKTSRAIDFNAAAAALSLTEAESTNSSSSSSPSSSKEDPARTLLRRQVISITIMVLLVWAASGGRGATARGWWEYWTSSASPSTYSSSSSSPSKLTEVVKPRGGHRFAVKKMIKNSDKNDNVKVDEDKVPAFLADSPKSADASTGSPKERSTTNTNTVGKSSQGASKKPVAITAPTRAAWTSSASSSSSSSTKPEMESSSSKESSSSSFTLRSLFGVSSVSLPLTLSVFSSNNSSRTAPKVTFFPELSGMDQAWRRRLDDFKQLLQAIDEQLKVWAQQLQDQRTSRNQRRTEEYQKVAADQKESSNVFEQRRKLQQRQHAQMVY